jgi:hypothetical protein
MRRAGWRILSALFAMATVAELPAASPSADQIAFFESRIRPVLAQDCYECHNSRNKAKGGLVLDHRDALLKGGDSGPALVPGNTQSLLLQAIRHDSDDLKMPKAGAKLDAAIVQDFEEWIRQGAPDPRDHPPNPAELAADTSWEAIRSRRQSWWSFQPIASPAPPDGGPSNHPVDRFIHAELAAAGLQPAPAADARTLIRRLSFTLTGLPPTPERVSKFVQAHALNSETAFNGLVDELLASPRYGERWARHWMDWIRYAESHGSEGDPAVGNAHLYRDYLIRALNADVPYDQLVREHIAGDLLESPRLNRTLEINESLIGTAHWRMVFHGFAPTDALDEKVRFTDDQINVFSKAFLGLTVSCARCHDHKFDAISQADYYALFGIFGSTRPGRAAIDLPAKLNRNRDALTIQKEALREAIARDWMDSIKTLPERLATLPAKGSKPFLKPLLEALKIADQPKAFPKFWDRLTEEWRAVPGHRSADPAKRWNLGNTSDHAAWFRDGNGLHGKPAPAGEFAIEPAGEKALLGIYPAGTYSHPLSTKHAARLTSPDFHLDGNYELWLLINGGGGAMARYVVQNYPRNGTVFPFTELKDTQAGEWRWQRYDLNYWNGDDAHIELTTARHAPLLLRGGDRSWFGLREALLLKSGSTPPPTITREFLNPLFQAASKTPPKSATDLTALYQTIMASAVESWRDRHSSDDEALLLDACIREGLLPNNLTELENARPVIAQYRRLEAEIPAPTTVPALAEWHGSDQPLFERGDHKKPLDRVPRRFLEAVDATPYETALSGRRELAEDVLREDNPFTRRVIVNRLWHHLFGRGLVDTPDNLGRLGSKPSHPELLDHLATRFNKVDRWSLKSLIRFLVTSQAWRQDSLPSARAAALDPDNRLLSHFSVRRLEAEAIRDAILQVSGRLDLTSFGEPVGGDTPRRSVYVNVIRNRLDPFLTAFDAPVPFSATGRRDVTTVPAQSLTLMNGSFVRTAAENLGRRLQRDDAATSDAARMDQLWLAAFARLPTSEERDQSLRFLQSRQTALRQITERAAQLSRERAGLQERMATLENRARKRIDPKPDTPARPLRDTLKPLAEWTFDGHAKDELGGLDCELVGTARIENGALVLDGKSAFARTAALPIDLREKTLEVRVQLNDLAQRAGGVMTVQTLNGVTFDAIVYAEKSPRQWLPGSNNFRRTESFEGPEESEATSRPVHIAIAYHGDGRVAGYRNGKPYGQTYRSSGIQTFTGGRSQIVFGLRHGTSSGGNRMLAGRILEARLYNRALKEHEIALAAATDENSISEEQLSKALTVHEREERGQASLAIASLTESIKDLHARDVGESTAWTDLALAVLNMKEFIYVR